MTETEYEYIIIEHTGKSKSGKTDTWRVFNKSNRGWLGRIVWYGRWRQYIFQPFPGPALVFSAGCLRDIAQFIEGEMSKRLKKEASDEIER